MPNQQNDQENEKFIKLVKQVKTLTKIVDGLQKEVDGLKFKTSNENDNSTSEQSKITNNNGSKSNPFQRLNIFRKDNKTKEKMTVKTGLTKKLDNGTDKESNPQRHRTSRSTQSTPFPKEVAFTCIVKTRAVQTENEIENSLNLSGITEYESYPNTKSSCKGCKKIKTSRTNIEESKTSQCSKDCPYLVRDDKIATKKKRKKKDYKKKEAAVETCQTRVSGNKKCKNNEIMLNSMENNRAKAREFISSGNNFSFDHKLLEKPQCSNDRPQTMKLHLLDFDGSRVQVKETHCKRCFKKCKTKNVLKINKAILTHDPPVIIMSPRKG